MTRALIDTNILICATLIGDPRFEVAQHVVLGANETWGDRSVSVQNLAEIYPNLTGPKMTPADSPEVAAKKIQALARLAHITVLPTTVETIRATTELTARFSVARQDYFDIQLAALMVEY